MPFATPTVEGWTIVGVGGQQGLLFRNGSGGHVSNGLLCNTAEGIEIEDKTDEIEDAYQRYLAGDLTLSNIVVTGGVDALDYDGDAADGDDVLDAYAAANGVVSQDIAALDYTFNFDANGSQAVDQLFLEVEQGSGQTWTYGWTFCDERDLFGDVAHVQALDKTEFGVTVFPNPTSSRSTLTLPEFGLYDVKIISATGALVAERNAVASNVTLPSVGAGTYVIWVIGNQTSTTVKWMVK